MARNGWTNNYLLGSGKDADADTHDPEVGGGGEGVSAGSDHPLRGRGSREFK